MSILLYKVIIKYISYEVERNDLSQHFLQAGNFTRIPELIPVSLTEKLEFDRTNRRRMWAISDSLAHRHVLPVL